MDDGWKKVLSKIGKAFLIVAVAIFSAILLAPFLSESLQLYPDQLKWFRLVALGIVAWGVLGRSGWEIQTIKGQTAPEAFNSRWFTLLYFFGCFCGALGVLVEPVKG
ncbi:hypothetical protein [Candidatus Nitronereus thalassa]|uniref:Uncharacterized protein n=1 Tax=Candidatus Nitronereus thalassa TaxID=3020898 RepID=A0ABU3K6S9_9BACT|nr:hypothetical protein [Candidatus Nitronereus thalassa]MDT7042058.1 hypothetical protein [Candidatus Nitronereus thalassa]